MADAAVDPPLDTAVHESGLSIPPLDDAFFTHQFADQGSDGRNDIVADEDFDLDFSFDDLWIPSADDLEELLNSTGEELDFLPATGSDSGNFAPVVDQSPAVFQSDSSDLLQFSGNGDLSGDRSPKGFGALNSSSPASESHKIFGYLNVRSPESNGSNRDLSENCCGAAKEMNCRSPESNVSEGSNNCGTRSVTSSPNLNSSSIRAGFVNQNIKLDEPPNKSASSSILKRKKGPEDSTTNESRISKFKKSNYNLENNNNDNDNVGLPEDDEKRKVRLMRNRESAQLSRHRKKQYVEELQEKVKMMNSTIQDLNAKISYFMTENATLRQQIGGPGAIMPPHPPPGMYPYPGMTYPWIPFAPPYMMKPQGSQVPLVPIPKLKPLGQKTSKKTEGKSKKNGETRTKKVAGISFIGLFVFILLFGGLAPLINSRYGGVRESLTGVESYARGGFYDKHHDRILMVNGNTSGDRSGPSGGEKPRDDEFVHMGNGSELLVASLYVPRNDKLVKIDGNLVIHSVLASEKAMSTNVKKSGEASTGLAVPGDLTRVGMRQPRLRALGSGAADEGSRKTKATDGRLQQWFREGLTGPMLSSGMCTEVLQFEVSPSSGGIVPSANISSEQNHNSTHLKLSKRRRNRNRRILQGLSLPDSSLNVTLQQIEQNSQKQKLTGNNSLSPMVVSILVDPREAADADVDGVMGTKSISRIFVVVLIDSVKYVTYSCMLPFKGVAQHLVTA